MYMNTSKLANEKIKNLTRNEGEGYWDIIKIVVDIGFSNKDVIFMQDELLSFMATDPNTFCDPKDSYIVFNGIKEPLKVELKVVYHLNFGSDETTRANRAKSRIYNQLLNSLMKLSKKAVYTTAFGMQIHPFDETNSELSVEDRENCVGKLVVNRSK